ncbi:MAG: aminotransferase class I/II-fold pyridoxal phosphate-dependent enzyme [Oscillospiraceae bacterium]|nr:aminotransferase class I/II-fold pyridoxal phosphate-dependent enzyme [Oscillospiraceae bacterium]
MGYLLDAIEKYLKQNPARFHMPGHKGTNIFGKCNFTPLEQYDLTEIKGLDNLYESEGCISNLEERVSKILGFKSIITAGGSTSCIQAMLASVCNPGDKIIVDRNVHISVVNSIALLNLTPIWLFRKPQEDCAFGAQISAEDVKKTLNANSNVKCVFLTGEDYYGLAPNILEISKVCLEHNVYLLVDNAHGAYYSFLNKHPMQLGASMCCDSWHKTLQALTGAAVLLMQDDFDTHFVKKRMQIFSSSSPSYLVLLSMDICADYLYKEFETDFKTFIERITEFKCEIKRLGFDILNDNEASVMKLTISGLKMGINGIDLAGILRDNCIEPEYVDYNCVVLLVNMFNRPQDFERLRKSLQNIQKKAQLPGISYCLTHEPEVACSIRTAMFAESRKVSIKKSEGCIAGQILPKCPPCVPVIMPGEVISEDVVSILDSCGYKFIDIIEEEGALI